MIPLLDDAFGYLDRLVNTIIQGGIESKEAAAGSQAQTKPGLVRPQIADRIITPASLGPAKNGPVLVDLGVCAL